LCRWVAEYYVAGIGDALGVAMPPGARGKASGFKKRRVAMLTVMGSDLGGSAPRDPPHVRRPGGAKRTRQQGSLTPTQMVALEILARAPAGLPTSELRDRGVTADVLARLAKRGLVSL